MVKKLTALHNSFFEHDSNNLVTMGIGFAMSTACILATIGIYQL